MSDNNIDEEVEQLKKQFSELGLSHEDYIKSQLKQGKSIEQANKAAKNMAATLVESTKLYKKSALEIDASIKGFKKSIANGEASVDDLAEQLSTLRDQINKTSDQDKKQALLDAKADLESMNARNQANKIIKDGAWSMAGALSVGAAKAFTGAAGKALAGGDSFEVASSMMTAGVDLINTANQGSANSLKTFGAATAGAGGKVGAIGVAASLAGEALGGLSAITSELAKAGIGFMLAQTKQLIAGFQSMSAAGAVYSGGMTSMTNTALSAHMTLEQFSKAVSANTANLSKSGLGVAEASKRMAGAMQKGGDAARNGMFALGMGMEEQADAYATTMALMAGPSGQLKASNAQVAEQTQEYAKNLKIISGITGQDAKARLEKVRQDNDTLAFNAVLNKMGVEERTKTQLAMAAMSEGDQRAFREKKMYGDVISTDLAASRATNSGIRKAQDDIFAASEKHALDVKTVGDTYQRNSAETLRSANEAGGSIGLARSGAGVEIGKTMNEQAQFMAKFAEANKVAATVANEQNKGVKGAGGTAVELMKQQQDMAVRMQEIALTHLPAFKTALEESYKAAMKAVEALDSLATAVEENPWKALLLSLAAPILQVLALIGPSILKGFKGGGAGGSMQNGQWKSGPGGPAGPGGAGSMYEAPHPSAGPGGAGSRYAAPKEGMFKRGLNAVKGAGKWGKAGGIAGAVLGVGMAASDMYDTEKDTSLTKGQKREKEGGIAGGAAGGAAGAWAGAAMGAAAGSAVPVVGTIIGGLVGGAVGYWLGQKGGEVAGKAIMKDNAANKKIAAVGPEISKKEMYEVNGQPVDKATYDKYLKDNPQLANMMNKANSLNQSTAPKPLASPGYNIATEQAKLHGIPATNAEAVKKAMEKPSASANPAEQQQITLLQNILASLNKGNHLSSGILQNSY